MCDLFSKTHISSGSVVVIHTAFLGQLWQKGKNNSNIGLLHIGCQRRKGYETKLSFDTLFQLTKLIRYFSTKFSGLKSSIRLTESTVKSFEGLVNLCQISKSTPESSHEQVQAGIETAVSTAYGAILHANGGRPLRENRFGQPPSGSL